MTPDLPPPAPPTRHRFPWVVALVAFLALAVACVIRTDPPLPDKLTLQLKFPRGLAGQLEPLISAGVFAHADFLFVSYVDETSARLIYNYWGNPSLASEIFRFVPGTTHSLKVEMPAFTALRGASKVATRPLRLEFDGRVILDQSVPYNERKGAQIFFGENPVGGTGAGTFFRGEISLAERGILRGRPAALLGWPFRLTGWVSSRPGEVALLAFWSIALGFIVRSGSAWLTPWRPRTRRESVFAAQSAAPHRWFLGTAFVCALAFSWVVTGGTFRFISTEVFGSFYDYQAESFLHGHLDVPSAALSAEAFVYAGKVYGYFGPTPALLRLPLTALDLAFGQLSRTFLLAYYLASLGAVYALLILASRLIRGRPPWPARTDVVLLVASAGLGTTLFFLGSRAYIYHEAILCGVAFALWSTWCSFRWLAQPASRWWLGALVCGTLAVHSRPPVGLFALTLLGCVAATHLWQARAAGLRTWLRPICIGLLSIFGVLSFNALSYLKFQSFDGAPLKYHVQYTPERLTHIEGKNFHPSNFSYNFDSYVWQPNFIFLPRFPFFYMTGRNPNDYPESKNDLAEPNLALPYAMPAVVFLAIVGGLYGLVFARQLRLPIILLGLSALPMSAALFMAIAISQRYTADFCPVLLAGAAFGLASAHLLPRRLHRIAFTVAIVFTVCSIFITMALTLHYQNELVWGVPPDVTARYHSLRQTIDAFFGFNYHDR